MAGQAFSLVPTEPLAQAHREELAFFQAVAVELRRSRSGERGEPDDEDTETAIRQVVSDAISATGVIDIYAVAGLERPDISIIDEGFANRLSTRPRPDLQIELLRRLLTSELKSVANVNAVTGRRFSDLLQRAMRAYTNRSLDAAEIIRALVELAQEMTAERNRGEAPGLGEDELAFYDAVRQNRSAVLDLGDGTLKKIASELVAVVRANTSVDWDKREQVRALLRSRVRRLLTVHRYPPDQQESAIVLVMQQAELFAAQVAA